MTLPLHVPRPTGPFRRLLLLLGVILVGLLMGWLGQRLTGSQDWYLAIPILIALVWMLVADPSQCGPGCAVGRSPSDRQD